MSTRHDHIPTTANARPSSDAAAAGVAAGLQEWVRSHDLHVQAAVWLLLTHEVWPRRPEFQAVCRRGGPGEWFIDWTAARAAFDGGTFDRCSTSERAILDLAIELGANRYRFSWMGSANARAIVEAVRHALGGPR